MANLTDTLGLYSASSVKSLDVMIRWADKAAVKLQITSGAVETLNKNLQNTGAYVKPAISAFSKFISLSLMISKSNNQWGFSAFAGVQTKLSAINITAKTLNTLFQRTGAAIRSATGSLTQFAGSGLKMSRIFIRQGITSAFINIKTKILSASGAAGNLLKKLQSVGAGTKTASKNSSNAPANAQPKAAEAASDSKTLEFSKYKDDIKRGMKIADDYVNMQTRLKAVNDGSQTQGQMQNMLFGAANRSRVSYSETANTFADLQASGGGTVFRSNEETLGFTELMQKSFKLGGTDSATQSAGIDQVVNAMGSGKIQGGDFDAIMSSAPAMLNAMETFTGKSKAELRSMAEEGVLTADTLKNSLFAASGTINQNFSKLPMTFEEIWTKIQNAAFQAFGGLIELVSKVISSAGFQTALNAVIAGILAVGGVLDWIINTTTNYFDKILPILEGLGGVLLVNLISIIQELTVNAVKAGWQMSTQFLMANIPLLIIMGVIVGLIYLCQYLGLTVKDVFSIIGGVIGVFAAGFVNYFGFLWNFVAAFINFLGHTFTNPIAAIKVLFLDLVTNVIKYIATMAHGIEDFLKKIPGVKLDITSGLDKFKDKLEKKSAKIKNEAGLRDLTKSFDFKNFSDSAAGGSKIATDIYTKGSEKLTSFTNGLNGEGNFNFLQNTSGQSGTDLGTPGNPATVQGIGSNGNLSVDMAEEDIQYLRDIAERDYINKFSTATLAPNIQVSFGPVHQEADADKVAGRIQTILREQIAVASEGVY